MYNKRLRELAEQAKKSVPQGLDVDKWIETYNKIFAELIVKDIIKIVEGYCETSPEIMGLPLDILEQFDMEMDDE